MGNKKKGISVIILSWNTLEITDKCLFCLKKSIDFLNNKVEVEVLVVDNNSSDGSAQMIAKKYPWVKLIKSDVNLGYVKGNNLAFKKTSKNDYLLLLNSDAYVQADTLLKSINYLENRKGCDVLGCRLEYENGKFQPSAGLLPTPFTVFTWMFGLHALPLIGNLFPGVHPKSFTFFANNRQVGWVMGAFLFMRREIFEKTKGFDENFFMYMEEVEWCRRASNLGYTIWYTPDFSITHLDKASSSNNEERIAKIFGMEILGLKYYLVKYYPNELIFLKPILFLGIFTRYIFYVLSGNNLKKNAYSQILKEL